MSTRKDKKREAKKQMQDARAILHCMEKYLDGKDQQAFELASAFCHILNYHFEHGDLRPHFIHLAALLRAKNDSDV